MMAVFMQPVIGRVIGIHVPTFAVRTGIDPVAYAARMILRRRRYEATRTMAMKTAARAGVDVAVVVFMKQGDLLTARENSSAGVGGGHRQTPQTQAQSEGRPNMFSISFF